MKSLTRVLIVHGDASFRARLAHQAHAAGMLADEAKNGAEALEMLPVLRPDLLILSLTLPIQDGLTVLERMHRLPLRHAPYVLALCALGEETAQQALTLDADEILSYPYSEEDVISCAESLLSRPFSRLARVHAHARLDAAREIVSFLGMSSALKGYEYLAQSIALSSVSGDLLSATTTRLYPDLAKSENTTPAAVERAIRHAIESTWTHASVETLNALFGNSVHPQRGKPTNAECIARLCDKLLEKLEGNL